MNLTEFFREREFYKITYGPKHLPFMSRTGTGFLFCEECAAKEFAAQNPNTEVTGPEKLDYSEFSHQAYARGFNSIEIIGEQQSRFNTKKIRLTEYTNQHLNRTLLLLHIYRDTGILENLKTISFIVPAIVSPEHSSFAYAVLSADGKEDYYAAFSDLSLFESFKVGKRENWKPLRVSFNELMFITEGHGLVLNPFSELSLFLSGERLEKLIGDDTHASQKVSD